jgi:hypothetical protein
MKHLFLLCGRLDGWDDDVADLIPAESEKQATELFVHSLYYDNGYDPEDRDHYVHQCDRVGTFQGPLTVELLAGFSSST